MKILFAATEAEPFVKIGGLGDVVGSLPKALKKDFNVDTRVFIPFYNSIYLKDYKFSVPITSIPIDFDNKTEFIDIIEAYLPDSSVPIYFVKNDTYFSQNNEVYVKHTTPYEEAKRFAFFNIALLEGLKHLNFAPDIIHANDWHTSFLPIFLKTRYSQDSFFYHTKTLLSIHNLAYQGVCPYDILKTLKLEHYNLFTLEQLEYYNQVNWLKGGIAFADCVGTVSPQYAKEIQGEEFGATLHHFLRTQSDKLTGILNGIDNILWNPETDPHIPYSYSSETLENKILCKKSLQEELGFSSTEDKPLACIISRLVEQKGLDLIGQALEDFNHLGLQIILLGTGDSYYENLFQEAAKHSNNFKAFIGFNAQIAQKIYAGCDLLIMPSRFEPCGLSQLIGLRYGVVPVVRDIGGLHDTIIDYSQNKQEGYGFKFHHYNKEGMIWSISQALEAYHNKDLWKKIVVKCMKQDFSIEKSASKYVELYKKITSNKQT